LAANKPPYRGSEYASRFKDDAVAEAYLLRPPYPSETFQILLSLLSNESRIVLDVGCGTGNIARNIVEYVDRVDAVDFSMPMINIGKSLPNGNHRNLNWIIGRIENVPLHARYSLIAAGQSLHWVDCDTAFARFSEILTSNGYVAIVRVEEDDLLPWKDELEKIMKKYSTYQCVPYDMIPDWEQRKLFRKCGEKKTGPVRFIQTIEDYVRAFHSTSNFASKDMGMENFTRFDDAVRSLVSKYTKHNVELKISSSVIWGRLVE
jgi:ubiquinone/menaquinone biosynthesis C-methylase UbiE